jgi:hypothetical protein
MFESGSKADTALKVLCMGAGSYMVAYMVGPLAGHLASGVYRHGFYFLYGTPSQWWWWLDINQWRGWINEGHVFYYAYEYGDKACALVAAPFFYTLPDLFRYCFTKQKPVDPKDRAILENELRGIKQLRDLLHEVPGAALQVAEGVLPVNEQRALGFNKKKIKAKPQASNDGKIITRSRSANALL